MKGSLFHLGIAAGITVLVAGCNTPPPNVTARQDPTLHSVTEVQGNYDTLGRRWGGETPVAAQPAPKATPLPAPTSRPTLSCSEPTWGLVKLNQTMPPEVNLGGEFMSELHVMAQACAANVVVRDTVPAFATYVRSEPTASVEGKQLTWRLGDLDAGASRNIKLWLKAEQEGTILSCASVTADPRSCAVTRVVKPAVQLLQSAPADLLSCDLIPITLTVQNSGSSVLTGVRVTNPLPDGLLSEGKSSLVFDIGNLNPGESKQIKFNATAAKPGKYVNNAKVTADQNVTAEAVATTTVHQPTLALACKTPDESFMGRTFDVCFTVVNKGDAPAAGTVVQVPVPAGLTFRSATAGGQLTGNTLTWNVGTLGIDSPQEACATFVGTNVGTFRFAGSTKGSCAKVVSASGETRVVGVAAILLEKADDPDPVSVGETTTYTVKVTNQGTADDSNVRVVVTIAPELAPVSATGNGTIQGQTVTFPVVPRLAAKDVVTYKIVAKGVKPGDGHTLFQLNSDILKKPITAEESTHVY